MADRAAAMAGRAAAATSAASADSGGRTATSADSGAAASARDETCRLSPARVASAANCRVTGSKAQSLWSCRSHHVEHVWERRGERGVGKVAMRDRPRRSTDKSGQMDGQADRPDRHKRRGGQTKGQEGGRTKGGTKDERPQGGASMDDGPMQTKERTDKRTKGREDERTDDGQGAVTRGCDG